MKWAGMNGLKIRIVLGFLFVSMPIGSFAQFQPRNLTKHWSIKDGLSQGVVNSITQDNQSMMWFATEDGLNRFDGYSFKVFQYDPDNKASIADNFVQSIFKDSEGTLWVSSRTRVVEIRSIATKPFYFTIMILKIKKITLLTTSASSPKGSAGNLWTSWYGSGFASFNKEKKTFIAYTPETLPGSEQRKNGGHAGRQVWFALGRNTGGRR